MGILLPRTPQQSPPPLCAHTLVVQLDNLRDKYGMRTVKVASLFAELNFPNKTGEWYERLKSYTDPAKNPSPVTLVVYLVKSVYMV